MRPTFLLLAATLLDKASASFSNHGCNDFALPAEMTEEDLAALADLANRSNFNGPVPAGANPEDLDTPERLRRGADDWILMRALAFELRAAAREDAEEGIRVALAAAGVTWMQGKAPSALLAEIVHDADGWVLDHSGGVTYTTPDPAKRPL